MPASTNPNGDAPLMTGRRTALQALAALSTGWLASLNSTETTVAKKKRKAKAGPPGPAGPAGPPGPQGPALATRRVVSPPSAPLVVGQQVGTTADCGGVEQVVTCGYEINAAGAPLANVVVNVFGPLGDGSGCEAQIAHMTKTGSVDGATVTAIALCLA